MTDEAPARTARPSRRASPFAARPRPQPRGVRVVVDARPMQEPERSPLTAWYLDQLLSTFAREPLSGESFVVVGRALRADPAADLAAAGLPVAGSRRIPPTARALRAAGLTLDSFLLRGAELGTGAGEHDAVFHTAGGAVPLASQLPVVATLLDLAPWELPDVYAASAAARFGHRLRARVLRDAARVIVCSRAVGEIARRRLHLPADRLSVVPLAVDGALRAAAADVAQLPAERERLELPPRYLAFVGRFDARKDLRTLLQALAELRAHGATRTTPRRSTTSNGNGRHSGPPQLVLALENPSDSDIARATRLVEREDVAGSVRILALGTDLIAKAAVLSGAEAVVQPALSDATGLGALEALALGAPVICSRSGALPEVVGSAGIVVEPRDPVRLAAALEAIWAGGSLAQQLRRQAHRRAAAAQRSWSDVAHETRLVYEAAAGTPGERGGTARQSIFERFAIR